MGGPENSVIKADHLSCFLRRTLVQRLNSRITQLAAAKYQALQHAAAARQEAEQAAAEAGLHHVSPALPVATMQ